MRLWPQNDERANYLFRKLRQERTQTAGGSWIDHRVYHHRFHCHSIHPIIDRAMDEVFGENSIFVKYAGSCGAMWFQPHGTGPICCYTHTCYRLPFRQTCARLSADGNTVPAVWHCDGVLYDRLSMGSTVNDRNRMGVCGLFIL